jgi:hypothetical protein
MAAGGSLTPPDAARNWSPPDFCPSQVMLILTNLTGGFESVASVGVVRQLLPGRRGLGPQPGPRTPRDSAAAARQSHSARRPRAGDCKPGEILIVADIGRHTNAQANPIRPR